MNAGDKIRVQRLPIWARRLFAEMDAHLTRAQQAVAVYEKHAVPSNTTQDPKGIGISLGDDETVRFEIEGGWADVRVLNGFLSVRSDIHTQLTVIPRTSHYFRIRIGKYERGHVPN